MAKTFIKYLALIPTTILYFFSPTQVFFSYQSHFLHSLSYISRDLYGSGFHKSLARLFRLTHCFPTSNPVSAPHFLCVCTRWTQHPVSLCVGHLIPLSLSLKNCWLRSTEELPSVVWKMVVRTSYQFAAREDGLRPWMKFSFFIYHPKMASGSYHTSRQLTSRIHITFPQQQMILKILFQSLHLPPQLSLQLLAFWASIGANKWLSPSTPFLFDNLVSQASPLSLPCCYTLQISKIRTCTGKLISPKLNSHFVFPRYSFPKYIISLTIPGSLCS